MRDDTYRLILAIYQFCLDDTQGCHGTAQTRTECTMMVACCWGGKKAHRMVHNALIRARAEGVHQGSVHGEAYIVE